MNNLLKLFPALLVMTSEDLSGNFEGLSKFEENLKEKYKEIYEESIYYKKELEEKMHLLKDVELKEFAEKWLREVNDKIKICLLLYPEFDKEIKND